MRLDVTNKRLLAELDRNARISIQQLAKKLRVNRDVVAYRINQLEKQHIITGYYAIIDYGSIGLQLFRTYFLFKNTTPKIEQEIIQYFIQNDKTLTVYETEGNWHLALGVLVRSNSDYIEFVTQFKEKFVQYIDVVQTSILVELVHFPKTYLLKEKNNARFSTGLGKPILLREPEMQFLQIIADNARLSLVAIAKQMNLSVNAVKHIKQKLEKDKVIVGYRAKINFEKLEFEYYKVDFHIEDGTILSALKEYAFSHPAIVYENITIGGSDFEFDIEVSSYEEFITIINELKSLFPQKIRRWAYYKAKQIHKWDYIVRQ